jgi:hypothetical protein
VLSHIDELLIKKKETKWGRTEGVGVMGIIVGLSLATSAIPKNRRIAKLPHSS